MRESLGTYRTPLKKFLNDFMSEKRNSAAEQIEDYRAHILSHDRHCNRASWQFGFSDAWSRWPTNRTDGEPRAA